MEPLHVVKQIGLRLIAGPVAPMMHALTLEQSEKALAGRVVGAVANRAHAVHQSVSAQELLVRAADELAAAIGVQVTSELPCRCHTAICTARTTMWQS